MVAAAIRSDEEFQWHLRTENPSIHTTYRVSREWRYTRSYGSGQESEWPCGGVSRSEVCKDKSLRKVVSQDLARRMVLLATIMLG